MFLARLFQQFIVAIDQICISYAYLAAVFAIGIVSAFIVIYTIAPTVIQFEASWTDALKTAQRVDTLARSRANVRLIALVNIWKIIKNRL